MLPLAGFLQKMRDLCAKVPERRTGRNARLPMDDIGMSASALVFSQSPSFRSVRKQLESCQGASNARTLFGIDHLPTDNYNRKMLNGMEPEHFTPVLDHVADSLEALGALDRMHRFDGRILIVPDGTEYSLHTALTASAVRPTRCQMSMTYIAANRSARRSLRLAAASW